MTFDRKLAEKLDDAAEALHRAGGKAGDKVANAVIAPIRVYLDHDCTRCERGNCTRT
jgi:hypothetical protein